MGIEMIRGGYVGKILRVDLTTERMTDVVFEEEMLRKYVGSFGLAMKIMYDEVHPSVRPYDPENRVIFMTGPLTGTVAPSSSRHVVLTLNTECTKVAPSPGYAGGFWAAYLKLAGYDGIIIQGAAKEPVYIWVHDDSAELLDAEKYWGKDTHETEDLILKAHGTHGVSVSTIGPAGENLVAGGNVISNDKRHISTKGGSVLGSKKLKAIAVGGKKKKVRVAEESKAIQLANEWRGNYNKSSATRRNNAGNLRYWGHPKYFGDNSPWILLVKNLTDREFAYNYGIGMWANAQASEVKPVPCYNCHIACSYDCKIGTGPYKGTLVTISGGAENYEGLGGNIGVQDGGTTLVLTDTEDKLGLDAATIGPTIALAYECYEKGLLTKEDTDGLELKWGNADAAIELLHRIVKKKGFGAVLAKGPRETAKWISEKSGKDAMEYCTHIKGGGFQAHDLRMSWEPLLGQFVCSAGPVIQGTGLAFFREPDLIGSLPERPKPFDAKTAPMSVRITSIKKVWEDCLGVCWFITGLVPDITKITPRMVSYVTGWNFTPEEANIVGERVINLQQISALRRGLRAEDNFDIGPRMLEPPDVGIGKGFPIEPNLQEMFRKYYTSMGWDEQTMVPRAETLRRLGLEELIKDVKALNI